MEVISTGNILTGAEKQADVPQDVIPLGKKASLTAGMGLKPRSSSGASPRQGIEQASAARARLQRLEGELHREIKLQVKSRVALEVYGMCRSL